MNNEEIIGKASGLLISLGIIPYAIRVWQGKITVNYVTWFIWFVAAYALVLNYKNSGAEENIWPAVCSCFNVTLVFIIALIKRKREPVTRLDWVCLVLAAISLTLWYVLGGDKQMATYALYVGILADAFAVIPTFIMLLKKPWLDRPFAWVTFSVGNGVNMLAISEHTISNYSFPVYMTLMSALICYPIIKYRIERRIPLRNWI